MDVNIITRVIVTLSFKYPPNAMDHLDLKIEFLHSSVT